MTPKKIKDQPGIRVEEAADRFDVYVLPGVTAEMLVDGAEGPSSYRFFLEEGSRADVLAIACEGHHPVRSIEADMKGADAHFSFKGLGVLTDSEENRIQVTARHSAPGTVSRQLYKSIVAETALSEFETKVSVDKNAPRSDSNQLCRNLLLSENARAVSKPVLNIENDDVACTHGATTGPMEESEVFYLRTRGLTQSAAKELLVYGFAGEILDSIKDKALRKELKKQVKAKLATILKEKVDVVDRGCI